MLPSLLRVPERVSVILKIKEQERQGVHLLKIPQTLKVPVQAYDRPRILLLSLVKPVVLHEEGLLPQHPVLDHRRFLRGAT